LHTGGTEYNLIALHFFIDKLGENTILITNMNTITYKPLETDFTKNQFRLRQIRREGDIAIFHRTAVAGGIHPVAFDGGFETIVVSRHDGYQISGVVMEPAECYPSNEQWGAKGWSYPTLFAADQKYERLLGRLDEVVKPTVEMIPVDLTEEPKTRRPRGGIVILNIPDGEFTTKELGEFNKVDYSVAFTWLKENVDKLVKVKGERRVEGQRGKASKTYEKLT
jgi:hypothetical protein